MIRANEFLINKQWNIHSNEVKFFKIAMLEYAKEAIKADRENLVNCVKAYPAYKSPDGMLSPINLEAYVDKDSILNAPQIELL